jgi:hypothetical protein
VAAVAGDFTFLETAHRGGAARAELFAGHEGVAGRLAAELQAQLPVPGQLLRVARAVTQQPVVRQGADALGAESGVAAVGAARDVLHAGELEAQQAGRQGQLAGIGQRQRPHRDVATQLEARQVDVVPVGPPVDAGHQRGGELAPLRQGVVVARAGHRALAADLQVEHAGGDRARIDVGIAGEEIHRVAQRIQRHVVAGAVDADLRRIFHGGRVLQAAHVVAAPQVRMLDQHAQPGAAGVGAAGVVGVQANAPGLFFGHAQGRIDGARLAAVLEFQRGLLGGIGVGDLQAGRDVPDVGRDALAQPGQAGTDVGRRKRPVALDPDLSDARLDDLHLHHAPVQFLLGQLHPHHAVAVAAIGLLQRFDRALHIGEVAVGTGKPRQQTFDFGGRQQAVAFDRKARDRKVRAGAAGFAGCVHGPARGRQRARGEHPEDVRAARPHSALGRFHKGWRNALASGVADDVANGHAGYICLHLYPFMDVLWSQELPGSPKRKGPAMEQGLREARWSFRGAAALRRRAPAPVRAARAPPSRPPAGRG